MHSAGLEDYFQTKTTFKFKKKFGSGSKSYGTLADKFSEWSLQVHSTCQEEDFWEKNSKFLENFKLFLTLSEKLLDVEQTFFNRVVETEFYVSRGSIWANFFPKKCAYENMVIGKSQWKKSTYWWIDNPFVIYYNGNNAFCVPNNFYFL